jgi:hypothetical protein
MWRSKSGDAYLKSSLEKFRIAETTTGARELYDRMLKLYPDWVNPAVLWGSAPLIYDLGSTWSDAICQPKSELLQFSG